MLVPESLSDPVERIRQFNRFYTQRVGALDESLLDSRFTLTEVRVLYELAHRTDPSAASLNEALHLDAGYTSRILARFTKEGLIRRTRSSKDARTQVINLTRVGRETLAPLEDRTREHIAAWLTPLSPAQHRELVDAMRTISILLGEPADPRSPVTLRPAEVGDISWVIHRQTRLYADEFGWNQEFEALLAEIGAKFIREFDPESERAWVAEYGGRVVGSVFLVRKSRKVAQLRLLYVDAGVRGLGIGARLVDTCIAAARTIGYRRMTLWTNSILHSARKIYESRGFRLMEEESHHNFGKDLIGQNWELRL